MIQKIKRLFTKKSQGVKVNVKGSPVFSKKLKDLNIGEAAYAVPWAYNPRTGYLDLNYTISYTAEGTASMPVTRTKDGYDVDLDFEYFGERYEFN